MNAQDLATKIIQEQAVIIGPLAWSVAGEVSGLTVQRKDHIILTKSGPVVLTNLVKKYEGLFGPASREVCREAVRAWLPKVSAEEVPEVLK